MGLLLFHLKAAVVEDDLLLSTLNASFMIEYTPLEVGVFMNCIIVPKSL